MKNELFLLEGSGYTVLFAPKIGLILEVKAREKERVAQLVRESCSGVEKLLEIFPELKKERFLRFAENTEGRFPSDDNIFRPTSAIIFPTFDCNLCCSYCYSAAGVRKEDMKWNVGKAVVDFLVRNAKVKNEKEISLEFHGGGEPTKNWPLFTSVLDYFQRAAQANNLKPEVGLATNGMLSDSQVEWIAARMNRVQVSLDGPEKIQNYQRPTAEGSGSFSTVYNTVSLLLEKGVEVTVHVVVTTYSVKMIPEIIDFFVGEFPNISIHLEPSYPCGRGLFTGQTFPDKTDFVEGFIAAESITNKCGIELFYSGTTQDLTELKESFCGVSAPNFVVTPDGLVTACHEIASEKHELARQLIYGHFDQQNKQFVFDYDKIRTLKSYALKARALCQKCFAQYQCGGDCLVKTLSVGNGKCRHNFRCNINRELAKHYVFEKFLKGGVL